MKVLIYDILKNEEILVSFNSNVYICEKINICQEVKIGIGKH